MEWIAAARGSFVPASHEDPRQPGVLKRVIAVRDQFQAGHVQMLNWAVLPGGKSFQKHFHQDMQETFVLISGQVRMIVDDCEIALTAGDSVLVEPGEVHQMFNDTEQDAEYIVFGVSAGRNGQTICVP